MKKLMLIFDYSVHYCSWFSCTFASLYSSFSTEWVKQIIKYWEEKKEIKKQHSKLSMEEK